MFATVKAEIGARLLSIEAYFRTTCAPGTPRIAQTAKGLAFVQMYSVYEYAVKGAVRAAINEIKTRSMVINTVRWELLSLILDSEIKSMADCNIDKAWAKRIALMKRASSSDIVNTSDSAFPDNGTQCRSAQLEVIWQVFGLTSNVVPDGRLYPLINEVVAHRNAIAHGQSTPEEIGGRFSKADIVKKILQCQQLCLYIVSELENHCATHANLIR